MKKILIVIIMIFGITILVKTSSNILIPKDAIRFRVIANSNDKEDQYLKKEISKTVQKKLYPRLLDKKTKKEAKEFLLDYEDELSKQIDETINENNKNIEYTIDYGKHYFPKKTYKGVSYEEGEYESLVITLGKGNGNNWWCVLFPPLCLLEAEDEASASEVKYKSLVKELLNNFLVN